MPFVCAGLCRSNLHCIYFPSSEINKYKTGQWRHSPPHAVQITPNQRSSFVPLKQTLYLPSFLRYNQNIFGSCDVTLHPSSSKSHKTGVIRLFSICAVERNVKYIFPF